MQSFQPLSETSALSNKSLSTSLTSILHAVLEHKDYTSNTNQGLTLAEPWSQYLVKMVSHD